ncbi:MAG TPA: PEP-CTERM sorting domain-containing protein [Tepidisphaeraceae bacterium]|jgi:hypothetical protein
MNGAIRISRWIILVTLVCALLCEPAVAATITFPAGGGTYSYDSLVGPDPNATVTGAKYEIFAPPGPANPFAYYYNQSDASTARVAYTFAAAPGETFTGGTVKARLAMAINSPTSRIDEFVQSNVSSNPVTLDSLIGLPTETYNTINLPIAGASSFMLWFDLTEAGPSGNDRLFLHAHDEALTPFVVTTTSAIPEPTTAGVVITMLGGALARRSKRHC